jgi:hypothetical protein
LDDFTRPSAKDAIDPQGIDVGRYEFRVILVPNDPDSDKRSFDNKAARKVFRADEAGLRNRAHCYRLGYKQKPYEREQAGTFHMEISS